MKIETGFKVAAKMPVLSHAILEKDVNNSEVLAWLLRQPEVLNSLFVHYKRMGAIVMAKKDEYGMTYWRGRDFGDSK